jgi:hypothetical protein
MSCFVTFKRGRKLWPTRKGLRGLFKSFVLNNVFLITVLMKLTLEGNDIETLEKSAKR